MCPLVLLCLPAAGQLCRGLLGRPRAQQQVGLPPPWGVGIPACSRKPWQSAWCGGVSSLVPALPLCSRWPHDSAPQLHLCAFPFHSADWHFCTTHQNLKRGLGIWWCSLLSLFVVHWGFAWNGLNSLIGLLYAKAASGSNGETLRSFFFFLKKVWFTLPFTTEAQTILPELSAGQFEGLPPFVSFSLGSSELRQDNFVFHVVPGLRQ